MRKKLYYLVHTATSVFITDAAPPTIDRWIEEQHQHPSRFPVSCLITSYVKEPVKFVGRATKPWKLMEP